MAIRSCRVSGLAKKICINIEKSAKGSLEDIYYSFVQLFYKESQKCQGSHSVFA